MQELKTQPICADLQLFAESGDTAGGEQTGENAPAAEEQSGVSDSAAENQKQAKNLDEAFDEMIKGEYKSQFDGKVQAILKGRLAESKATEERMAKVTPMLENLAERYGLKAEDIDGISQAVERDDEWLEEEAVRQGKTVEELREKRKADREISQMRKQIEKMKLAQAQRQLVEQAEEVHKEYPDFDLDKELKNPTFNSLIRNPFVTMKAAYEVVHKDEILRRAVSNAEENAKRQMSEKIAANGIRPSENGTASQSAALVSSDVSKLTKEQRQAYIARAQRGERITKF